MDAMPLLRSCRDDLPEPDDAHFAALRARLDQRLVSPERTPRRPVRLRRGVVLGAVAATAAACLVVALVTAGPAPRAAAEAGRVLQGAASTALAGGGVDAARTIVIRSEGLSLQQGAAGGIVAAYGDRRVTVLHVPAGAGDWVRTSWVLPPTTFYGGDAARRLARTEGAIGPGSGRPTEARPAVERSADGDFTNGELGGGRVFGDDPAALRRLPRDPDALLRTLRRADLGAADTASTAEHVLEAASAVLGSGAADGGLQAAVFRALERQPGLTVTAHAVDLAGRTGVAIGATTTSSAFEAHELIIDPGTGEYLGDRAVALVDQGVVPAGAALSVTAVEQR